ncbi:restriction endonuclease [Pseudoxanthomonas sp. PXM05]|nr:MULTISPECIES: BsuBI/PstI family type II restriction endonuclease [unclassified Pseudoxanthomonas]MBV7472970.1 restriction endonuclease [Pseudoxanthomonas sp. PXM05]
MDVIRERLPVIFPDGIEHRNYAIRETAVRVIYTMFYVGAIQGSDQWLRPSQVTEMSPEQGALLDEEQRIAWIKKSLSNQKERSQLPWYASNSREQVRDETIRTAFISMGAVIEREGLAPTSSKPRYALASSFADLFRPGLTGNELHAKIDAWQARHLSKAALSRVQLVKHGITSALDAVAVTFPGQREVRSLKPGPSSVITKAVIEVFAPRFLKQPAVLWISESGNKVVAKDDALMKALKLNIDPSKMLPDIILVDLGHEGAEGSEMLVVFVEVVASDGPITRERKVALTALALSAGFDEKNLAFLTAYQDRGTSVFRKGVSELAWGSYAWCVSEPHHVIEMHSASSLSFLSRGAQQDS